MHKHQRLYGVALVILGAVIFISFAGHFILAIIATILSLLMVNHGLKILGKPPLFVLAQHWLDDICYR